MKRAIVCMLGIAAVITTAGLVALVIPPIRYRLRESELIETIKLRVPPAEREAALRELGTMRSVRAIPHIIEMWGEEGVDHAAGRAALVAIGEPAIPSLRQALEDPHSKRRLMALVTCTEMGPAALPLLPKLLELYRRGPPRRRQKVDAIRAIGEAESVKEVAGARGSAEVEAEAKAAMRQGPSKIERYLRERQAESEQRRGPKPAPGEGPIILPVDPMPPREGPVGDFDFDKVMRKDAQG
jgi:hypothetical protein